MTTQEDSFLTTLSMIKDKRQNKSRKKKWLVGLSRHDATIKFNGKAWILAGSIIEGQTGKPKIRWCYHQRQPWNPSYETLC